MVLRVIHKKRKFGDKSLTKILAQGADPGGGGWGNFSMLNLTYFNKLPFVPEFNKKILHCLDYLPHKSAWQNIGRLHLNS